MYFRLVGLVPRIPTYLRVIYHCCQYQKIRWCTKMTQPIQDLITSKITQELKPVYLDVINESYMHNVPKGSETHFKVVIVSDKFENISLIQRHRLVNSILEEELKESVHALSIQAKTSDQWIQSGGTYTKSPPCMGGAGK